MFRGYKILGSSEEIETIVEEKKIEEVIIAVANYSKNKFQNLLQIVDKHNIVIKHISVIDDGKNVKINDLSIDELNRSPIDFNVEEIEESLNEKVVLVTGAGGLNGSELCRQIFEARPQKLIFI